MVRSMSVTWVFLVVLLSSPLASSAAVFTVTSTGDEPLTAGLCSSPGGPCTLRAAIEAANAAPGPHRISFDIPPSDPGFGDGYWTIGPASRMPRVLEETIIDGTTQSGAACAGGEGAPHVLKIRLDGNRVPPSVGSPPGLPVHGPGSLVRGLSITKTPGPGVAANAPRVQIECSYLGLAPDGSAAGNQHGVVLNSSFAQVGGSGAAQRNILSGNRLSGIRVNERAEDNAIEGNYIGTDSTGTAAVGNITDGVYVGAGAYRTRIGGANPGAGNVVSGNQRGIAVGRRFGDGLATAFETVVQGNRIGTDSSGTVAVPNTLSGVVVASPDTLIGGSEEGAGNLISGNAQNGVRVVQQAKRPRIEGNRIGVAADGRALGNGWHGIDNFGEIGTIGGDGGAANTIAHNGGNGVTVHRIGPLGSANVLANSIHSNSDLGIDASPTLGADGVTANDPRDATNPDVPNYPVLTRASSSGGSTTIEGSLDSLPSKEFELRFYANRVADPSGHGEGETHLGAHRLTTDAAGAASFSVTLPVAVAAGQFVAATATSVAGPRMSSEFSGAVEVTASTSAPFLAGVALAIVALAAILWWFMRRRRG